MEILTIILQAVPIIIAAASAIAALTPTPRDDQWIGKLYKIFIEYPALNVGKAKQSGKHRNIWGYGEDD